MLITSIKHADEEFSKLELPMLLIGMRGSNPTLVYKVNTVEEYMSCTAYIFASTGANVIVGTSLTGFSPYKEGVERGRSLAPRVVLPANPPPPYGTSFIDTKGN